MFAALQIAPSLPALKLPAFTAYTDPATSDGNLIDLTSPKTKTEWGGYFAHAGQVHLTLTLQLPVDIRATYRLISGSVRREINATGTGQSTNVDLGTLDIAKPEWRTFWVQGTRTSGTGFGKIEALVIEGAPIEGAHFNLKRRRNSASVHLLYPTDPSQKIEWFYNEVTAKEDPLDTYYMACGFNRGYFGMQVNGPGERRVIFSIWDAGNEKVDRTNVDPNNQVRLLGKGKDVFASGFGNEGTGGHSHLSYPWKTGVPQKFLIHAVPAADKTLYSAYFMIDGKWNLIAKFSSPHDGQTLHGLYSFVEDFNSSNGNFKRKALYGPAWIKTASGPWIQLTTAKFSHDGTGGKDRFDYDFGIESGRFYLQNGGFQGRSPKYGTPVQLAPQPDRPPSIKLDQLPEE